MDIVITTKGRYKGIKGMVYLIHVQRFRTT